MPCKKSDQYHRSRYFRVLNDEHDIDGFAKPIDNRVDRTPLPVAETLNICIGEKRLLMTTKRELANTCDYEEQSIVGGFGY